MHVDRNWFALPSDPIGTVVTRVHREKTSDHQPVTYGLETSGPPVPFRIDPKTGEVTVNDTLTDKVGIVDSDIIITKQLYDSVLE